MAKGMIRMSEKRIAASSSGKRHLGRSVAVVDQVEEAALLLPKLAIFRQVTAGLTHHPYRRRIAQLTSENGEQGLLGLDLNGVARRRGHPSSLPIYK